MKDRISTIINEANKHARLTRPLTPEGKYLSLWQPAEHFLHCCIESIGCIYSRNNGACIMCDYGIGRNLNKQELAEALETELSPYWGELDILLFGSYGSIFDESEISKECFETILKFLTDKPISTIIFETHCATVTKEKLEIIKKHLPKINIVIEMGFESSDTYVLNTCLNKSLDLNELKEVVKLIHGYDMDVCLNVFLGAPFLNTADQLDTAIKSVLWAHENGADSIVIFPANIKPFTLLYKLYQKKHYQPISQWLLIELLNKIPQELLADVTFAWYGDRKNFYEHDEYPLVPPFDCPKCHDRIFGFYHDFLKIKDVRYRVSLVRDILMNKDECSCYKILTNSLTQPVERITLEQIERMIADANG